MKKFTKLISIVAALAMMAPQLPVLADTAESAAMEQALIAVKSKVDIPEELTEFTGNSSRYSDEESYSFDWSDKDGYTSVRVDCDDEGRIRVYRKYDYNNESLKYIGVTPDEAKAFAQEFLMKIAPEAFADENDCLVYEGCYFDNNYNDTKYDVLFTRYHDGNKVGFGNARVCVEVSGDQMDISYAEVLYDYDTPFEEAKPEITEPETVYKQAFPLEMVYVDNHRKISDENPDGEIRLIYRIAEDGEKYISAYTGEVLKNTVSDAMPVYQKSESMLLADVAAGGVINSLSPAEMAQIEEVGALKSEEDCMRILKSIPMLRMAELDIAAQGGGLRKNGEGEYTRYLEYHDTAAERHINASFDAVRGRLTYFSDSRYMPYAKKEPLGESKIMHCNEQIDAFLDIVAQDVLPQFVRVENDERDGEVCRRYARIANGIEYTGDSLYVDYDAENDRISSYSLDYNINAEFADPSAALGAENAYDSLMELSPLEKGYVKIDKEYRLVYYLDTEPLIDAFTGKKMVEDTVASYVPQEVVYNDIDNHWCAANVKWLRDIGIAFDGTSLEPDSSITQADILRLFTAGVNGNGMMKSDIEAVYEHCYRYDIIDESERNDNAVLSRESAFMYMVRLLGYDAVAKLPGIYKVKYADGDKLSEGMLGYAAILSGMGIINGDGSEIRPVDNITRAEALTMVYNYLTLR